MTQQEFEQDYAERSNMTLDEYHELFNTYQCVCGNAVCSGWQAVLKSEDQTIYPI